MYVYILLLIAIVSEVFASSMLKLSNGFKNVWASLGVVIGYALAFYTLSLTLKHLQLGTAYAVWAGLGTALTAIAGVAIFGERFNFKKLSGIAMIIVGVVVLNLFGGGH